ncbi:MAG: CHAT domain-containing protein [Acidobacteriota bacterium]|nr:CHAT domain-containing protein [Acidobacteriota bacterium]
MVAHHEQGDFSAVLDHAQIAFDLASEVKEPYGVALANYNLGLAYDELELYSQAIKHYETALSVNQSVTNPPPKADVHGLTEDILRRTARACFTVGNIQCSLSNYSQLVDIGYRSKSNNLPDYLNLLATAQHESGEFEIAKESCQKSLAISEPAKMIAPRLNSYRLLGYIHSDLKNHVDAINFIEKAKAISKGRDKRFLENLYLAEGVVYYNAGQFDRARSAYESAIKLVEERQARTKASVEAGPLPVSYQYAPYARMIELLVSQGQILEALNYSERAKSRYLFDLLSTPNAKEQFAESSDLERQQQLLSQILNLELQIAAIAYSPQPDADKLTSLQTQIHQAQESLKAIESEMDNSKIAIAEHRPLKLNLSAEDLSALIPDNKTAVVQFAIGKRQTFLFVATKPSDKVNLRAYPINIQRLDLQNQVAGFRHLIVNQDQTDKLNLKAKKLHDVLLGAAQPQLESVSSLIIIPDGPLWELPFQALKMPNNQYLTQQHAISYTPSLNTLRKFPKLQSGKIKLQSNNRLLALGNPALKASGQSNATGRLMDQPILPLPETEMLIRRISQMYGVQKSLALTGNKATEDKFKSLSPRYSIIHLATHGLFNDLYPMRSRIVLSQTGNTSTEDGYLEAGELAKLKLQADLVILSACETGRGQIRDGEGIIGLPWAIFVAGCPTAVVSQWKVEAQSTVDLMLSLHKRLNHTSQKLSKSEALRQAALDFITNSNQDLSHPFHWAGFIVMGQAN